MFIRLLCVCPLALMMACSGANSDLATASYDKTNIIVAAVAPIPGVTLPAVGGFWMDRDDAVMPLEDTAGNPIRSVIRSPDGTLTEDAISMWGQSGGNIVGSGTETEVAIEVETLFITGGAALQYANGRRCEASRGSSDVCVGTAIQHWQQ